MSKLVRVNIDVDKDLIDRFNNSEPHKSKEIEIVMGTLSNNSKVALAFNFYEKEIFLYYSSTEVDLKHFRDMTYLTYVVPEYKPYLKKSKISDKRELFIFLNVNPIYKVDYIHNKTKKIALSIKIHVNDKALRQMISLHTFYKNINRKNIYNKIINFSLDDEYELLETTFLSFNFIKQIIDNKNILKNDIKYLKILINRLVYAGFSKEESEKYYLRYIDLSNEAVRTNFINEDNIVKINNIIYRILLLIDKDNEIDFMKFNESIYIETYFIRF